jgi:Ca2+-binding EF-hand superfamily protein
MAKTFMDQIYLEREIEKLKIDLANKHDFSCPLAFQVFDFYNRGELSKPQFAESLFSYIGFELYSRNQSFLLFSRYDEDRDGKITYREFSRMLLPVDRRQSDRLLNKLPDSDIRMSHETQDLFRALLKAHLKVAQAHEFIRERFGKKLAAENWMMEEMFEAADSQQKYALTPYDVERLIIEYRKSGSRTLTDEVEVLFAMYDREGVGRMSFYDFKEQLTPLIN